MCCMINLVQNVDCSGPDEISRYENMEGTGLGIGLVTA